MRIVFFWCFGQNTVEILIYSSKLHYCQGTESVELSTNLHNDYIISYELILLKTSTKWSIQWSKSVSRTCIIHTYLGHGLSLMSAKWAINHMSVILCKFSVMYTTLYEFSVYSTSNNKLLRKNTFAVCVQMCWSFCVQTTLVPSRLLPTLEIWIKKSSVWSTMK